MKTIKKWTQKFQGTKVALLTALLFPVCSPQLIFADANAKEARTYLLNDWIAPIFGVIVVLFVIRIYEF